jgi:hypothetical protein
MEGVENLARTCPAPGPPPFQGWEEFLTSPVNPPSAKNSSPFTVADIDQLKSQGITEAQGLRQLEILKQGQKPVRLNRPATLNDGIVQLSPTDREDLKPFYAEALAQGRILAFIPASGAATRMFKSLTAMRLRAGATSLEQLILEAKSHPDAKEFLEWFNRLKEFAFWDPLKAALHQQGQDLDHLILTTKYQPILTCLLTKPGLGYAELPKALIPFHNSPLGPRTALEEQLAEGIILVKDNHGLVRLHFTVSPDHEKMILELLENLTVKYALQNIRFEIKLSQQKSNTNTIAVYSDYSLVRTADQSLALRPGGHGALIENLYLTNGDIVFVKNIDNLVPERLRPGVMAYRQTLGGYLIRLQTRIFNYLNQLQSEPTSELIAEVSHFVDTGLGIQFPKNLTSKSTDESNIQRLEKILDRPLRVCAMVKNQGEPGGGPFWVKYPDETLRLQIVEGAQMDKTDPTQKKIADAATHFNPVDLVCGLRNRKGQIYPLQEFVDQDAYFLTPKSLEGKAIMALELPGLWNGSMAFWNTVFVEMPVETFNPVKTVNDLLRPSHRN